MEASYRFFQNDKCEYFPCHKIEEGQDFNCLFCYCPLYSMGDQCGGNYIYLENGIKSCEKCLLPHLPQNYDIIEERLRENSDGKNDLNNDFHNKA